MDYKRYNFALEYLKDFNERRSAIVSGLNPDENWLEDTEVSMHVHEAMQKRMSVANIDAAWLMQEMVDNHHLARQKGQLSVSRATLADIGKLAAVDAFAAEKVKLSGDDDIIERLKRGRDELSKSS